MNHINLSDGEWKIMKLLWKEAPRTIAQMVKALEGDTGWTKTTIFVMLRRLAAKGAVRVDDSGRSQLWYPAVERMDAASEETSSFLSKVWEGSLSMMISSMAGQSALSAGEIAELRRILDEAEQKGEK
ncbi:MAG: BlaI/MecI/CopY family transcriptional regulator [Clostridia bacterium]|nr:BlaI/MecI/CopY family transcriptional regulator [Clostridia bacterium]